MNIETKTVEYGIDEYLKFGWSHTEDRKHSSGRSYYTEHILARDKDMPNYKRIKELEDEYFGLKRQIKGYSSMDLYWCFILFLLMVFPFFIYWGYKANQKQKREEHDKNIKKKMDEVLKEVATLL